MKKLEERDPGCVLRAKPNARKVNVIASAVPAIRGQQERMVNAVPEPKRHAVSVILDQSGKHGAFLD
jgi:hypothetical protein